MIEYNINDVESTAALLEKCRDDIDIRLFIEKEYGINALSMDSVKFGETILLNEYCKKTKLDKKYVKELRSPADTVKLLDVILPFIKYKNPKLQAVLEDMRSRLYLLKNAKATRRSSFSRIPSSQWALVEYILSTNRRSIGQAWTNI